MEERFSPSYSRISAGYSIWGVVLCMYAATAIIMTIKSTATVRIALLENFTLVHPTNQQQTQPYISSQETMEETVFVVLCRKAVKNKLMISCIFP